MNFVDKSNTYKVHFVETLNLIIISILLLGSAQEVSRWKCALGEKKWGR